MSAEIKNKLLMVSLTISILYSLFYAIPLYINSTILGKMWGDKSVSLIYTISAILTFISSIYLSKYIKKIHNYKVGIIIILISFISTIGIGFSENKFIMAASFIGYFLGSALLYTVINLFIEEFSNKEKEGEIRGIFLTLVNAGILMSPLIAGQLMATFGYKSVYLISAFLLIPILIMIRHYYTHITDPSYVDIKFKKTLKEILKNKAISKIMLSAFVLESFFAIMAIYAPLYIISNTTITIEQYVGVIMPFALIPFVLLPYELGWLADKKYGEKEMMIIGLIIVAISALTFPLLHTNNIFYISALLFVSRIGASMVETMNHTYFYKKVALEKVPVITIFNNMRTLAYIVAPIFALLILQITNDNLTYVFITYAILALMFIMSLSSLKDTK